MFLDKDLKSIPKLWYNKGTEAKLGDEGARVSSKTPRTLYLTGYSTKKTSRPEITEDLGREYFKDNKEAPKARAWETIIRRTEGAAWDTHTGWEQSYSHQQTSTGKMFS